MWALLCSAALAAEVLGAVHKGTVTGDQITWESTYELSERGVVRLVGGEEVLSHGRRLQLTRVQPDVDGLAPPLAADTPWQRITVEGATFTPSPSLHLDRRIQSWAPPELDPKDRLRLDRIHLSTGLCLYVDEERAEAGRIPGSFEGVPAHAAGVGAAVAGLFAGVVGLMVVALKVLRPRAEREHLDAYIREEFVRPPAPRATSSGPPPHP